MIQLASLMDVKGSLNVWADDDDDTLSLYIQAASRSVVNYLKGQAVAVLGDLDVDGQPIGPVPEEVRLATIMLVGFIYRDPDGNDSREWERGYLPRPVTAILYPLRDPAINGLTSLPGYGGGGGGVTPSPPTPPDMSGYVEEAPKDGTPYVRQDGTWVPTGEGVGEAPVDGTPYVRQDGNWEKEQLSFVEAVEYSFNGTLTAPPGAGQLRMNNADQTLATELYAHFMDAPGTDVSRLLKLINASMKITLQDKDDATRWQRYNVIASPSVGTNYVTISVAREGGGSSLPEQRAMMTIRGYTPLDFVPT